MTSISAAVRSNAAVHFLLQALNLAAIPVLTRSVSPEDLSVWFLLFNFVALLASLGALRYELAIVTAKTEEEALGIFVGASSIALLLSGGAGSIMWIWYVIVGRSDGFFLSVCAATAGACGALIQCMACWHLRTGRVVLHTVLLMTPTLLTALFQILFARAFNADEGWLVFAGMCGYAIPAVVGLSLLWSKERSNLFQVRWTNIWSSLARNRRFAVYSLPFTGAVFLRERAIYVALGFVGNSTAVSMFGLSHRLVGFANAVVSAPLRPVFFRFAAQSGISEAKEHVDILVRALSWLIVPGWTAVLIWAPEVLGVVFGKEWLGAAPYLRLLSIPFFIVAASGWLDRMYDVLGEQGRLFVMESIFSVAMVAVLVATLYWSREPLILTAAMGVVSFLYGWVWLGVTYVRMGLQWTKLTRTLINHAAAAGAVVLAFQLASSLGGAATAAGLVGAVVLGLACYGLVLILKHWRLNSLH